MTRVNLEEARQHLTELVDAAIRGEEVLIANADSAVVRLTPVPTEKPQPKFGSARGLIHMADDFDAPLEDFREYME